jgi:hypothetical protein
MWRWRYSDDDVFYLFYEVPAEENAEENTRQVHVISRWEFKLQRRLGGREPEMCAWFSQFLDPTFVPLSIDGRPPVPGELEEIVSTQTQYDCFNEIIVDHFE